MSLCVEIDFLRKVEKSYAKQPGMVWLWDSLNMKRLHSERKGVKVYFGRTCRTWGQTWGHADMGSDLFIDITELF